MTGNGHEPAMRLAVPKVGSGSEAV